VALGLGALFSLGIVFVREVLDATDAEFGVLIALFGVGAVGGLAVLQVRRGHDPIAETRLGVAAIGLVVAVFSLAGSLALAFAGAAASSRWVARTLASGMGAQAKLDGLHRVLAFAAFHVVIRIARPCRRSRWPGRRAGRRCTGRSSATSHRRAVPLCSGS
jgi:hypothetical protein